MTKEEVTRIYRMGFDAAWGLACDATLRLIDEEDKKRRMGDKGRVEATDRLRAAIKDMKGGDAE